MFGAMESFSTLVSKIFVRAIEDYHLWDNVDHHISNPCVPGSLEALLYEKCWVDTAQWHLEDAIRNPQIDPVEALAIKRRIDTSNQVRTDMVEYIDSYLLDKYKDIKPVAGARLNTETPAWAIDRLSILALKIYHMEVEATRGDVAQSHRDACAQKFEVLLAQRVDLSASIDLLLEDIEAGRNRMKVYKQMKMYNDPALNPILYAKK